MLDSSLLTEGGAAVAPLSGPAPLTPASGGIGFRRHGEAWPHRSAEYVVWQRMIDRCRNPRSINFPRYGGRGIDICAHWRDSYVAFLADMGRRPEGCELDRIDPDGNYEPENCRWLPRSENRSRARRTVTHCSCGRWVGPSGHHFGPCNGDSDEDCA
jgi:hypothetical protein